MDSEQLSRLPEIIRSIIQIDHKLDEIRRAKVVRLSPDLSRILKYRRSLVSAAHDIWGRQSKGKKA